MLDSLRTIYLTALLPPGNIAGLVSALQNRIFELTGDPSGLALPPLIPLRFDLTPPDAADLSHEPCTRVPPTPSPRKSTKKHETVEPYRFGGFDQVHDIDILTVQIPACRRFLFTTEDDRPTDHASPSEADTVPFTVPLMGFFMGVSSTPAFSADGATSHFDLSTLLVADRLPRWRDMDLTCLKLSYDRETWWKRVEYENVWYIAGRKLR
jgi:hypothetical protein